MQWWHWSINWYNIAHRCLCNLQKLQSEMSCCRANKLPEEPAPAVPASVEVTYSAADPNEHIEGICELIEKTLGWRNPDIIRTVQRVCPSGVQIALDGKKIVGVCIVTPLDEAECFVSVMAVRAGYRRRGLATRLFGACAAAMGDRNLSLYSDRDAVPFYRTLGFSAGTSPSKVFETTFLPKRDILEDPDPDPAVRILPMRTVAFQDLHRYDTSISITGREFWLRRCYDNYQESVVAVDTKDAICGYGVILSNPGEKATKLQPILAESDHIAKKILMSLLRKVPEGREITLKPPAENAAASELIRKLGFHGDADTGVVMFTQHQIQVPVDKVFSLMNMMNQVA